MVLLYVGYAFLWLVWVVPWCLSVVFGHIFFYWGRGGERDAEPATLFGGHASSGRLLLPPTTNSQQNTIKTHQHAKKTMSNIMISRASQFLLLCLLHVFLCGVPCRARRVARRIFRGSKMARRWRRKNLGSWKNGAPLAKKTF